MLEIYLEKPVEWKPIYENIWKIFNDGKQGKNYPVCEPLCIIILIWTLKGFHGTVGWIQKSNDVAQQLCSITKYHVQSKYNDQNWNRKNITHQSYKILKTKLEKVVLETCTEMTTFQVLHTRGKVILQ